MEGNFAKEQEIKARSMSSSVSGVCKAEKSEEQPGLVKGVPACGGEVGTG